MTETPPPRHLSAPRRRWLLGGAATAGLAAGAWFGLTRGTASPPPAHARFWGLSFDQPGGGTLALNALRGRPLLVNFWATWCAPCVREMPQIDRFYQEFKANGWQVLGLAIDGPTPVREFLGRIPVGFPIGLAGLEGTTLVKDLGNEQGGLPFTVVFDADGRLVRQKMGETSYEELADWARALA